MKHIYVVMYKNFTALDVFGPVDVLSRIDEYKVHFVSLGGGIIENSQSIQIVTEPMTSVKENEIILIPGGFGSRTAINNTHFINALLNIIKNANYILCVCTGTALVAKTGMLDGKTATSNKKAFDWVIAQRPEVNWNRSARWCVDEKYYTSAGVSSGMDMALGFVKDCYGERKALAICNEMEYHWNSVADHDIF